MGCMKKRRRAGRRASNISEAEVVQNNKKKVISNVFALSPHVFPVYAHPKPAFTLSTIPLQKLGVPHSYIPNLNLIGGETCQKKTMSN